MENCAFQPPPNDGLVYCNATFDDLQCWNYTLAGTTAFGACPKEHKYSYLFTNPKGFSKRKCSASGRWVRKNYTKEFLITDYSPCGSLPLDENNKQEILNYQILINIYVSGCVTSVFLLIVAIVVFKLFRQLRCPRVTIHLNLFISYILSNISWTIMFINSGEPLWCYVLNILATFTLFSNYSWMWGEGCFLFLSLVNVYSDKEKLLKMCCCFGWIFPVVVMVVYIAARITIGEKPGEVCWQTQDWTTWIYLIPIALLLLINIVFLIHIIRILASKLRSTRNEHFSHYRKTARAVLLLVPLLGIHFVLMVYSFPYFGYRIIVAILTSYQVLKQTKKKLALLKGSRSQGYMQNGASLRTSFEEYAIAKMGTD
ncbi:corticotropin-releasing factor receptor 2-like isoform X2 [Ostrea edulis]|uniref:corticotropin-releasing factor receptor 2-like isoform X2 n=1 Tax=Ostrea edulis TaxID=37623 RepID=UPI0024AFF17F|nr:corticotropin-releasing factor receptor 2-like isoform X2 [Ostrea edulis]